MTNLELAATFAVVAAAGCVYLEIMLRKTRNLMIGAYEERDVALGKAQTLRDANNKLRDDLTRMRDDKERAEAANEALAAQLAETKRLMERMTYGAIGHGGAIIPNGPRHARGALAAPESQPEPESLPEPTPLRPNGHRSVKDFRAWPPNEA
jgi:hypothetical protein